MSARSSETEQLSAKEMETLEKLLVQKSDELTSTRNRLQAIDNSLLAWEKELIAMRTEIEKLTLELDALSRQEEDIKANMSVFESEAADRPEDAKRVKDLRSALDLNEKALAKAKSKSDAIESRCKDLQTQIMEAGGPKLKMQRTKVEGMTKALEDSTTTVSK